MTSTVDINDNISMTICPTISPFVIEGNILTSYTNSPCDDAFVYEVLYEVTLPL
jgi:hypothetical protein